MNAKVLHQKLITCLAFEASRVYNPKSRITPMLTIIEIIAKGSKAGKMEESCRNGHDGQANRITEDKPNLRTADLRSPHRSALIRLNSLTNSHRAFFL